MLNKKIGIIGAGRVGCALTIGLKEKGYKISGVCTRNSSVVDFLKNTLGFDFRTDFQDVVKESDMIFITVPDACIEEISLRIAAEVEHSHICCKTFIHCSGAASSDVLKPLRLIGAYTASMHPLQTFADLEDGWKGLNNIYFGFEGSIEAQQIAENIADCFNSKLLVMDKGQKPLYHAAACFVSNYVAALSFLAGGLLHEIGFDSGDAHKVFLPLLEKSVQNIGGLGSVKALTGPISRGDIAVVESHLAAMKKLDAKYEKVYRVLGKITVEIARSKGTISEETANRLNSVMEC
ncbi:MAG: DUF2520 domain-containing protein [Clostridia bacterium]|nr:DUF2520 domain-containing protein [Clostridia bacterium]